MKKHILKVLTLATILFLWGCETEDENHLKQETELELGMVSKMITSKDLESNTAILNKLKDIFFKKEQFQDKNTNENTYSILTDSIRLIEYDGVQTYTFEIERSGNKIKNQLENLIIKKYSNDSALTYICRYNFIGEGLSNLKADLSIQDLVEKIEVQFLDIPPSNLAAKGPYEQMVLSYQGSCWVVNKIWADENGGVWYDLISCPGCSCSSSGSAGAATPPQYLYLADWGLSGGGGGSSGGGTGSPGGSGSPSGGGLDVSVPAVSLPLVIDKNLKKLREITNNSTSPYKASITTLQQSLQEPNETGFEFQTGSNGALLPAIQKPSGPTGVKFGPPQKNTLVRMHCHTNDLDPVFSAEDISGMTEFYVVKNDLEAEDDEEIVSLLISDNVAYALTIEDTEKAWDFHQKMKFGTNPTTKRTYSEEYKKSYQREVINEAIKECGDCSRPEYNSILEVKLIVWLKSWNSGLNYYKGILNADGTYTWIKLI